MRSTLALLLSTLALLAGCKTGHPASHVGRAPRGAECVRCDQHASIRGEAHGQRAAHTPPSHAVRGRGGPPESGPSARVRMQRMQMHEGRPFRGPGAFGPPMGVQRGPGMRMHGQPGLRPPFGPPMQRGRMGNPERGERGPRGVRPQRRRDGGETAREGRGPRARGEGAGRGIVERLELGVPGREGARVMRVLPRSPDGRRAAHPEDTSARATFRGRVLELAPAQERIEVRFAPEARERLDEPHDVAPEPRLEPR